MSLAPTPVAALLAAAGAPIALLVGVMVPERWTLGLIWLGLVLAGLIVDALLGHARAVQIAVDAPQTASVGEPFKVRILAQFPPRAMIAQLAVAAQVSEEIDPGMPVSQPMRRVSAGAQATLSVTGNRRGRALVERLWLRWTGPLGLVAHQRTFLVDALTIITPDIRLVRSAGVQLFRRDALHGLVAQLQRGEGSDFEALNEYRPGMDRRAIDWKASARHADLLAKEFRTERDNRIVFAIDCGRAMSEPLEGVPRVDRAVASALLAAYAALQLGDRVSLYAYDSRPRVRTGALTGIANFPLFQREAAAIDYSSEETNHTFGLSSLALQLTRRSLIVLFSDFTDPTGADMMVNAIGWLLKRHVVLFVILRDQDLADFARAVPETPGDVARAVTAAALLNEQRAVILRLRRMGLDVLEAPHNSVGLDLVNSYIRLKQRGRV